LSPFDVRFDRVRDRMRERSIDTLLLSVGADLPWISGYEAMPLERLTMLVLPAEGDATLVVPALEAPRVVERPELFSIRPWTETEDPIRIVADQIRPDGRVGVGDTTWARFVIDLQALLPRLRLSRANEVTGPLRSVKDPHEIDALVAAGAAVDRIAIELQRGDIALIGRTEAEVSAHLGRRILEEGHHVVNFAIVAAGENAASPHHEPGSRVIRADEAVLCDFGGTMHDDHGVGYCSDITRCVWTGSIPAAAAETYAVLLDAQQRAMDAVGAGPPCASLDAMARDRIVEAGFGEYFVHRTGHGIGVEAHEDPYIVASNDEPLLVGHAFSIEPGIYLPGRFGFRLEDCVAVGETAPIPFTSCSHDLASVEA
jgi:Xaa-Pro aminopeptidase